MSMLTVDCWLMGQPPISFTYWYIQDHRVLNRVLTPKPFKVCDVIFISFPLPSLSSLEQLNGDKRTLHARVEHL